MSDKKSIVDQNLIRELAALLNETGLTEIEVEHEDTRIRVARGAAPVSVQAPVMAPPAPAKADTAPPAPVDPASHAGAILSPMVGTAFRAPEPGGRPYIEVGDRVSEGQTLLIIEAMKTMNQIPAPRAGTVVRIMVEDGHPVEFGEPLIIVE